MTEAQQRRYYFPNWNSAFNANWRREKCRVLKLEGRIEGDWVRKVEALAQQIALQHHRAPTADDLRHACHALALGRDKSSADLDNREVDRVVTLFRLLADPDDLDAVTNWDYPEIAARKRLVYAINSAAPHAYIDTICRGKFSQIYEPPFWEDLPIGALRHLALTLRNRKASWGRKQLSAANAPF